MRVKFMESCSVSISQTFQKGSVHDLQADEANRHIKSGAAIVAPDEDEDVHTALEPMQTVKKAIKKRS